MVGGNPYLLSVVLRRKLKVWVLVTKSGQIYLLQRETQSQDHLHSKILDSYQENYSYFEENIAQNE